MSAPPSAPRKLFVTTALPYANGPFHIGHIMEYIQADIWVRFQRMQGHEVHFVCADDTHGAPIMLKADEEGITPEQLIARVARDARRGLAALPHQLRHHALHALAGERGARRSRSTEAARPQAVADRQEDGRAVLRSREGHVPRRPLHQGRRARNAGRRTSTPATAARTAARPMRRPTSSSRTRRSPAQSRSCTNRSTSSSASRIPRRRVPRALDARDAAAAGSVQQDPGMARRRRQGAERLGHLARRALLRHRDARRAGQVLLRLARCARSATLPR